MFDKLQRECDFYFNSHNNKLKLKLTVSNPKNYIYVNFSWQHNILEREIMIN